MEDAIIEGAAAAAAALKWVMKAQVDRGKVADETWGLVPSA